MNPSYENKEVISAENVKIELSSEEEEIYTENIIDHYKHPHNQRELARYTVKQHELNPLCGDEITLYLELTGETIADASFQGHGCAISQASISMLTDLLKGKTLAEAQQLTQAEILTMLGIPISHTRLKCALLSLKTLHGGLHHVRNH